MTDRSLYFATKVREIFEPLEYRYGFTYSDTCNSEAEYRIQYISEAMRIAVFWERLSFEVYITISDIIPQPYKIGLSRVAFFEGINPLSNCMASSEIALEKVLVTYKEWLFTYAKAFLEKNRIGIEQILIKDKEQTDKEIEVDKLQSAIKIADRAFKKKDYQATVLNLAPFAEQLDNYHKHMLQYCNKMVTKAPPTICENQPANDATSVNRKSRLLKHLAE